MEAIFSGTDQGGFRGYEPYPPRREKAKLAGLRPTFSPLTCPSLRDFKKGSELGLDGARDPRDLLLLDRTIAQEGSETRLRNAIRGYMQADFLRNSPRLTADLAVGGVPDRLDNHGLTSPSHSPARILYYCIRSRFTQQLTPRSDILNSVRW